MGRVTTGFRFGAGILVISVTAYTAHRKIFCREKPISQAVKNLFNNEGHYEFPSSDGDDDTAARSSNRRFFVRHLTSKNSTKDERDEAIDCLTRSFAGTTKTAPEGIADWAFCARTENIEAPLSEPPTNERLKFFRFMATWTLHYCLPRDGVFCLIAKDTKRIVAVTCTMAPKQSRPYDMGYAEIFSLAMKTGPPPETSFEGSMRRLEALGDGMEKMQKTLYPPATTGKSCPPLYVWMFGTDPECQGTGCGSALIKFLGTVADADGVECYLETDGVRNEGFYTKKGGFETKLKMIVESKGQRFDHNGGGIGMIRPAKTRKL